MLGFEGLEPFDRSPSDLDRPNSEYKLDFNGSATVLAQNCVKLYGARGNGRIGDQRQVLMVDDLKLAFVALLLLSKV